ncbi:hypothetical protein [Sporichthya sp.]|uniref:hypothetical protein n=1 Tax=Sporichthya sp. TaxID=65475 RepID=UPI0017972545|nr:hypothetical protein [Sporichthya sp.]MBA3741496.1 hypothetical protein [Sporichthya sp.]
MNPEPIFTDPPEVVQLARLALASAQLRLALDEHPLDPCCDLTAIGLAFLSLESVYPPYPPLTDIEDSDDQGFDIADAVRLLGAAIVYADTAADVARYAATIADLAELDLLADNPGFDVGGCSAQWP